MAKELSEICVSFHTAMKLKDSGIVIESVFSWFINTNATYATPALKFSHDNLANWTKYPAPTAEELVSYLETINEMTRKWILEALFEALIENRISLIESLASLVLFASEEK